LTAGRENRSVGMRGFISPTAVHLGSIVVGSAILTIPAMTAWALAILLGLGGLAGAIYGASVAARIWKLRLAIEDRLCYGLLPIAAYVAILAAAIMIVVRFDSPLHVLAGALILLLVVAMRNAWDMASFMVVNDPKPQSGDQP
jgi:hypothetical protein